MRALDLPTTPSFRLDGRRALVTGAGRGIGLAVASAFAEAGADVTLCARSAEEIERATRALRSRGWAASALTADVTDVPAFQNTIASAAPYDIFFNNAGLNRPKPFVEVPLDDFDATMSLNVRAAFFAAQAVSRKLIEMKRPGSIINMSSQMGHVGAANRSLYCASKWAVEGFSRAMAIELGPYGIRVNTLCPTFIETSMTRPFLVDDAFRENTLSKIKLGRLGTVEDLMGAAVFLASDASALMTGSALLVDGGWTAE
ncbi:SDR family oxidoreductase [Pendulispora rubella]|uniref:SDR family oxidoreductase n=1 Tax=Pendulispora rubella TaxID=2741070 RepID=A0ABZ2L3H5_9BACT